MRKSDLKDGMRILLRNKDVYELDLKMAKFINVDSGTFMFLSSYREDLSSTGTNPYFDIIEIYQTLWKRPKRKVTMKDIIEEFGEDIDLEL